MEDLKLEKKFYGFSTALILALVFTAMLSVFLIGEINRRNAEISQNWLPSIVVAEELNTMTSDFRIAEIGHVISQDDVRMKSYERDLNKIEKEIDLLFDTYINELITNDIDLKLITDAKSKWVHYMWIHDEMIKCSYRNDTEASMHFMEDVSEELFVEVSAIFLELVTFNRNGADEATLQTAKIYEYVIWIVVAICLMAVYVFIKFKHLMDEIKNAQIHLNHAKEEAMLSSKAKSNFLANMSHEIRTPMNAISGMVDIILRDSEEQDTKEHAHNIKRACSSLISIVNDVLDISKIESGKLEIIETEYRLSSLLNDVIAIANNRLEDKKLMFVSNFKHDLPEKIIGDEIRVKQILVNILNNAIKFTHTGHIIFNAYGDFSDGKLNLKFDIIDTGMGISQEDIDKLFIEFERVNTKKNRSIEGTGLGLAITKRLCEMMDGDIHIESKLDEGSKFTISITQRYDEYIPYAVVEKDKSILIVESRELYLESIENACKSLNLSCVDSSKLQSDFNDKLHEKKYDYIFVSSMYHLKAEELVEKYELDAKIVLLADNFDMKIKNDKLTLQLPVNTLSIANILNGKQNYISNTVNQKRFTAPECRVLIVDDNIVNLKVAQGLMKPYMLQIDTAENGKEAVEKIKLNGYDLVFMDHMMPIMDGIDATVMIRSFEKEYYQKLPIIALTANAIIGTREMFIENGMNDFISKPINLKALNDVLVKWIPSSLQIVDEPQNAELEEDTQETLIIEGVDVGTGLSRVGGDLSTYINILDMYYKDGIKRVCDLKNFYDNHQMNDYKIYVHALKSASGAIGAMSVSEKAKLLEEACNKENWLYIDQNNDDFISEFNLLLENVRMAIKGQIKEDTTDKEYGDIDYFMKKMDELKEALDLFDVKQCDELLVEVSLYKWEDAQNNVLVEIKDLISMYEYDRAIEILENL